jgi:hypothetical protein
MSAIIVLYLNGPSSNFEVGYMGKDRFKLNFGGNSSALDVPSCVLLNGTLSE